MSLQQIDYETAEKYISCLLHDNGLSPIANDELRRMVHHRIAKQLGVSEDLIYEAAKIVEYLIFDESDVFGDYKDKGFLVNCFKRHLDEIYFMVLDGAINSTELIAGWTFDMLHPELLRFK